MQYYQDYPIAQKPTYTNGNQIDFLLRFENKFLIPNSVRISGTVNFYKDGSGSFVLGDNATYDATLGCHALFQSFVVKSDKLGVIESIEEYGRMVKMEKAGTKSMNQISSQANELAELCSTDDLTTYRFVRNQCNFSFKPYICLNKMLLNGQYGALDNNKTGNIKLTTRLSNILEVLFGDGTIITGSSSFQLSDLRIDYITVDNSPTRDSYLITRYMAKQIINSSNANFSVKIPSELVRSFCGSFMDVSHAQSAMYNNFQLENPDGGIQKVYYSYRDSTNGYFFMYPLESQEDILNNAIKAYNLKDSTKDSLSLVNWERNWCYLVGIDFVDPIDLQNNPVAINIQSGITKPYNFYMVFHSIKLI